MIKHYITYQWTPIVVLFVFADRNGVYTVVSALQMGGNLLLSWSLAISDSSSRMESLFLPGIGRWLRIKPPVYGGTAHSCS